MSRLSRQIEHRLEQTLGVPVAIEIQDDIAVVTGMVDSGEVRDAALQLVHDAAPTLRVEDNLDIAGTLPAEVGELDLAEEDAGHFTGATAMTDPEESLEPGDLTDQDTLASPQAAAGPSTSMDDSVSDGDTVYTPPIDPVGTDDEVIGGFQQSSMDSVEVAPSALDDQPGDEALRDAILRELREDATTTALSLDVVVERRIACIRGTVPYLDDAENAEAVAARVPGILEVRDETTVTQLESTGR